MPISVDTVLLRKIQEHLMLTHQYPPCTANICAYLFFDYKRNGVSFDELIAYFEFSKSTVSTALHQLVDCQHVTFYNREASRKRLFLIDKDFVLKRYKGLMESLINEQDLLLLMKAHMSALDITNEDLLKRLDIFVKTLDSSVHNLEKAVHALERI